MLPANHAHKQARRESCISDGICQGLGHRGIIRAVMNTCPLCGQTCEWTENEIRSGYECKPCRLWFRVTKDANGGPLLDFNVISLTDSDPDLPEIQPKLLAWWAKLNEQWGK